MLRDILRFHKHSVEVVNQLSHEMTVAEFMHSEGYSKGFVEHYLLPMGAAIWSCPTATFQQFPVRFMIEFYRNHGMLQVRDRPIWRTITGGSRNYVSSITSGYRDAIRLKTPVRQVVRTELGVEIATNSGTEGFDEVIFACHSDQALKLLSQPAPAEREVLSKFPYSRNVALLHTDDAVLPRRKTTWSSWNYRIPAGEEVAPSVTYNMNILQCLKTSQTILVTLNDEESIDPARVLGRYAYSHPVFTTERRTAQLRHHELIRTDNVSYCGAYWGNGFHEDGVNSALAVCRKFGVFPQWQTPANNDQQPRPVSRDVVEVA
jgi:predicted NAD/FAD-binding protein